MQANLLTFMRVFLILFAFICMSSRSQVVSTGVWWDGAATLVALVS
jgi:hypothetical protein